jgi:hypothetical protein
MLKPHIFNETDPKKAVEAALDDLGYPGATYVAREQYVTMFTELIRKFVSRERYGVGKPTTIPNTHEAIDDILMTVAPEQVSNQAGWDLMSRFDWLHAAIDHTLQRVAPGQLPIQAGWSLERRLDWLRENNQELITDEFIPGKPYYIYDNGGPRYFEVKLRSGEVKLAYVDPSNQYSADGPCWRDRTRSCISDNQVVGFRCIDGAPAFPKKG